MLRKSLSMLAAMAALTALTALSACGNRTELTPKPGKSLPVAPYGRESPLPPAALLKPPVQAAPTRSVELRSRSEQRADDPYDLPPAQ